MGQTRVFLPYFAFSWHFITALQKYVFQVKLGIRTTVMGIKKRSELLSQKFILHYHVFLFKVKFTDVQFIFNAAHPFYIFTSQ